MISDSVELRDTEVCFLHIQPIGTRVRLPKIQKITSEVDYFESSKSPAKSESWNKPNRQCWPVLPTWQYCRWSLVWWMYEIKRAERRSQAPVHLVTDRADCSLTRECQVYQFVASSISRQVVFLNVKWNMWHVEFIRDDTNEVTITHWGKKDGRLFARKCTGRGSWKKFGVHGNAWRGGLRKPWAVSRHMDDMYLSREWSHFNRFASSLYCDRTASSSSSKLVDEICDPGIRDRPVVHWREGGGSTLCGGNSDLCAWCRACRRRLWRHHAYESASPSRTPAVLWTHKHQPTHLARLLVFTKV